jgi:predicted AlkP superfamily phosphohydrolase/phosphomutase
MLGLDGLAPAFLEAPVVRDAMPNLGALLAGASVGVLRSTLPPYTAPAWTSITTGLRPDRHGVFGFTDREGRPVTGERVTAPRVWDHVGAAGGRSVVVNVPITHPPRPVGGVLVSGMPAPPGTPYTWPSTLAPELEDLGYVVDVPVREGAREPAEAFDRLRAMTEARGRALRLLAAREPWDLLAVVFVLPDRLGHPWWKDLVPGDALYATRSAERVRSEAAACLKALDDAIGELLSTLPSGTGVVLCSDHGFGPLDAELFFDLVLAREGLIDAPAPSALRRAATAVGRSKPGSLLPASVRRRGAAALATAPAGASRSAWTGRPYEAGVRLADPDDAETRGRVTALLEGLRDPNGRPVVRAVHPRPPSTADASTEDAVDLLCEMANPAIDLHDGMHANEPFVRRDRVAWGTHTPEGVVAIAGAGETGAVEGEAADVAPTLLALLGIRPADMDGTSLVAAPDDARLAAPSSSAPVEAGPTGADEDAIIEHLRALGYVD